MRAIYSFAIILYSIAIKITAAFGNQKAKLWVAGRKNWEKELSSINPENKKVTWFHVASLGEFEQARPLIEAIKQKEPKSFILLSFFSPSGFEIRKNYELADKVTYLPIDTPKNAKLFLKLTNPQRVIFVKYEFWFNFLNQISEHKIECYLVSGIFRKSQHFFKWYGHWFKKHLSAFTFFFVQNETSVELLKSLQFRNVRLTGDTRLDRVMSITREVFHDLRFTTFATNSSVVIFGSSWEQENEFAVALSKTDVNCKIIIAPHEINSTRIETLKNRFSVSCKLLSKTKKDENLSELNVLIIDQIGLLSKLYRYADCAFIGGGFGHGIHNTLEAVAYSKPVLFGPNYHKFQEAYDLINEGAGYCVANEIEFLEAIRQLILDEEVYKNASKNAASYILQNQGATQKIISLLYSN